MKLLGSTKSKTNKDKNGENVPHLKITEVVLIHCNIVNNNYNHDSRVLYAFVPNKSFGHLVKIEIKDDAHGTYNTNIQIKLNTFRK